ncbi:MAG TPA: hypothetical protein VG326_08545 [Tepidisphaeraceae bacterium]|jgi:hypothetical protein|nr:hypothetical protein [Tepidisphaeraceae bacterium]
MSSYFWSSASSTDPTLGANWTKSDGTTGTAPGSGDDAYVQSIPGIVLANIGAADMSAVALNSLTISSTYIGTIGTADTSSPLFGYWKIGAVTWTIGAPSSDGVSYGGSGRVKIDFGAGAFSGVVLTTGPSVDSGVEPVRLLANNAASSMVILGGRVGVATNLPGETASVGEIDVSGGNAICDLGAGVTWTTANVSSGGAISSHSGSGGTLSVGPGGLAITQGAGAIATIEAGGNLSLNHRPASGAAVTTLNLYPTGVADFSQNPAAVAVATLNHHRDGVLIANAANPGHLTVTTRNLVNCGTLTAS